MQTRAAVIALFVSTVTVGAQEPAKAPAANAKPIGTLAQVMRGIYFPNANTLFDVQSHDPGVPRKPSEGTGTSVSETFANIYTGWQVVENAAIALAESVPTIMVPGRLCQNGKLAPTARADYQAAAENMRVQALAMLKAAQAKNLEAANDATNNVADACAQCHEVYRDKGEADSPARCTP